MSEEIACDRCNRKYILTELDVYDNIRCWNCGKYICLQCQALTAELCIECYELENSLEEVDNG